MENEKRLIDANALLEKMQYRLPKNNAVAELINECVEISRKQVMIAPTVDAVEVVRCKDCKWYDADCEICVLHSEDGDTYDCGCDVNMKPDDFCSYGERSEEE